MHPKHILVAVLTALLALTGTATANASPWQQHRGPVLTATLPWEGNTVQEPTVMWDHGRYRLWYTADWSHAKLGYAESKDGIHWRKHPRPILTDAVHSSVVKTRAGFNIYAVRDDGSMDIAFSKDGIHVTGRRPSMRPKPGTWASRVMANTFAWRAASGWKLLYEVQGDDGLWQTAMASGGGPDTTWKHAPTFLKLGVGGMAGGPWRDGKCLYFHASYDHDKNLPTDIFRRCGPDLHHLGPAELMVKREQAWQFDQVADPSIARAPGEPALMLFDGMDNRPGHETGMIGAALGRS